ncbi:MAG TPA: hypothetical protein VFQ68_40485 [Streptosporangiaceae bacterium]|nr:hypothetical protein [Streptosporangiaceae bacterium]
MANRLEADRGRHQLHADIGWFIGALAVALVIGLRFTDAPRRAARTSLTARAHQFT